jgi:hypothetical protein
MLYPNGKYVRSVKGKGWHAGLTERFMIRLVRRVFKATSHGEATLQLSPRVANVRFGGLRPSVLPMV